MKLQTTLVALAITAATINAAPVELEERGRFSGITKIFNGGGSKPATGADAPAPAYNKDSAGTLNAGMGLATQAGLLGVNGMNTQATENKNNDPAAQKRVVRPAAPGRSNSSPAAITNDKNPPTAQPGKTGSAGGTTKPADPAKKPDSATSSDYMNTAANSLGMANLGMGLYNADQALQATQKRALPAAADLGLMMMGGGPSVGVTKSNYQEAGNGNVKASGASSGRRSLVADELLGSDGFEKRALPAAAGWGLALMGGGPSVGVTKSNSQSAGNGNVHLSGSKSRRQLQDESSELQRRLISFSHTDSNQQSAGNGNVVASGASSGGVPSNADNLMASLQAGAAQKQKQKRDEEMVRRLFSVSKQDYNHQYAGNGNVVASGASSGGVPSNADILTASMQAGGQKGGKRALLRRLVSVNTSDRNQQVAGNGNMHMSGAKSGASPQFLASLNPGTAGAA
ncbi:uncharacterized protein FA14DRAFT_160142 [Meira miltonrushii]|uniref:Uncharacterized protein n=1 Tax=Meira miltonrushii TaxID=1280837 RepID=A0A316VAY1_9BASI|nr:uncharacterized protein FA14DRAFT_160142 [Meira miltonrushii]PWN34620.1 hypothetical protein FA14DRAFT_160142 [Meira miltonrushii]